VFSAEGPRYVPERSSILIKKIKKVVGGGHYGGARRSPADFVTAMMAFLLMWLINTTDPNRSAASRRFRPCQRSAHLGLGGIRRYRG
jgi:chemotaxis protein MotB